MNELLVWSLKKARQQTLSLVEDLQARTDVSAIVGERKSSGLDFGASSVGRHLSFINAESSGAFGGFSGFVE